MNHSVEITKEAAFALIGNDEKTWNDLLAALEDAEFLLRKAGLMAGPMRDSFNRSASDARAAIAKAMGKGEA